MGTEAMLNTQRRFIIERLPNHRVIGEYDEEIPVLDPENYSYRLTRYESSQVHPGPTIDPMAAAFLSKYMYDKFGRLNTPI